MRTLGSHTGYLEIDHRDSPGIRPEDIAHVPEPVRRQVLVAVGGKVEARDVRQCSHCQRAVLLEPKRVRARAVCLKCYAYICDECEAIRVKTGTCTPFEAVLHQEQSSVVLTDVS